MFVRFEIFTFTINAIFRVIGKTNPRKAVIDLVHCVVILLTKLNIEGIIEIFVAFLDFFLNLNLSVRIIQVLKVQSILNITSSYTLNVSLFVAPVKALNVTFVHDLTKLRIVWYALSSITFEKTLIRFAISIITELFAVFYAILFIALEKVWDGCIWSMPVYIFAIVFTELYSCHL